MAQPEPSLRPASPSSRRLTGLPAVALVAMGAAVAQSFGRFTYGVLLPAIRDDLNLSNTIAGSIGTVNVGAYLVGTIVVAASTSRFLLLDVMRAGFMFSTVGLVLSAIAPGASVLGFAQFLSGLGGALIWIPSPVVAADALAPEKRSVAVGLMGSGIGLGVVFTGQLSAWVRSTLGDESWRTVYLIQALIGIVVMLATIAFIGHRQDRSATRPGLGGFSALKRMRGWVPLTMAYTSFGFMYLLVIAFLTTRLEDDNGWTGARASLAFTLVGVAMIFGGPAFVALSSRLGTRFSMTLAFMTWSTLTLVILPGWFAPTLGASIVLGLLFSGLPSMITLYVVENTTNEDYGASFAAATLAFGIAQMLAPQVGGLVADLTGSFAVVFALSAFFGLAGAIAAVGLPRPE